MRPLLALVLLTGCASSNAVRADAPDTTIIVVRHAEKALEPKADPPLSPAGAARAEQLVAELSGMPVTAVLSTDYARTRSTAAPLATKLGLTTELVDARAKDHARQVAEQALRHRGKTVLVVGHSNTVPDIVAALGASKPADICDGEYDNLFIVRVTGAGVATAERRSYGAPKPVDACVP